MQMREQVKYRARSAEETKVNTLLSRLRPDPDEAGLTMVEVMVSIVIFAIAASALVMGLVYSKKSVRDSRLRVQAANLASRESEIVRNEFTASPSGPVTLGATSLVSNPHPLTGGTAGQPLVVDNTPFSIKRTVQWIPSGSGSSPCDGGTAVTYPTLDVHIEVTWPTMNGTKPVVSNTILTPPKGTLNSNLGFVAVKVTGSTGAGVEGLPVVLSGASGPFSRTTESDGCTVFQVSSLGSYTATLNTAGYVTSDGLTTTSKTVSVAAGTLQVVPFAYDRAASITTTLSTLTGYNLPSTLPPVTAYNTGLATTNYQLGFPSTAATITLTNLWPFSSGYSLWPSNCYQADPGNAGGTRTGVSSLTPGGTATAAISLAPVQVTVRDGSNNPVSGATVLATPVTSTGCATAPAESPLNLGTTSSTGVLQGSIPSGQYTLSVSSRTSPSAWPKTASTLPFTTATPYSLTVN
jgi:prepilin-type N-terminal cleavage/methylation domain-containing protein